VLLEDFVFIKLEKKNLFIYNAGLVLKMEKDEVKIRFTKKMLGNSVKIVFPDVGDNAYVNIKDIS